MSIECEEFAHKGTLGKTTSIANELIIIPQMGFTRLLQIQKSEVRHQIKKKSSNLSALRGQYYQIYVWLITIIIIISLIIITYITKSIYFL